MRQNGSQLSVEYRPISALLPYKNNPRTHSDEQVDRLAKSLERFGWTNPVLVDGANGVIAGHGRLLAARKLGIEAIPCIELSGLSEAQKRAYIIFDNKSALDAGWDADLLRIEIGSLQSMNFDLSLTGFSEIEIGDILAQRTAGLTDPDETPGVPEVPVTQPGNVWQLGRHRLVCGDATNADDVAKALAGVAPHLMVTDPPYGVDYDPDWRNRATGSIGARLGGSWATSVGTVAHDARVDWSDAWMLFAGDVAYVWHAGNQAAQVAASLEKAGLVIRAQIVWVKQNFVISRGHYHSQHEPCWYLVRKGCAGHWNSDRKQSTVWEIANRSAMGGHKDDADTNHSTQKPVECMKRPIENNSKPGDPVYDPFVGSGTSIIAAEMTGRVCHAIEIDPAYCDVAVIRWQNFSGLRAVLEASGREFDEIKEHAGC